MVNIKINNNSRIPKYQQIIRSILEAIDNGELEMGDKLPSLNHLCKEFSLSQDTVLYAYNDLKARGVIVSTVGKGYFISSTTAHENNKIFLLFDSLTLYKESLYNSILEKFKNKGRVEIFFHHNNKKVFANLINEATGNYSSYVIIPILDKVTDQILKILPQKKVFLLDQGRDLLGSKYAYVCQRFDKDVFECLQQGLNELKKYDTLYMVSPGDKLPYKEIQQGFERFAKMNSIKYKLLKKINKHTIRAKEFYLILNDIDLVEVIKRSNANNLCIGKDVGIISYNKSPLKEVMANGIATISTDFEEMGKIVSDMILKNKRAKVDNRVEFIKGGSL